MKITFQSKSSGWCQILSKAHCIFAMSLRALYRSSSFGTSMIQSSLVFILRMALVAVWIKPFAMNTSSAHWFFNSFEILFSPLFLLTTLYFVSPLVMSVVVVGTSVLLSSQPTSVSVSQVVVIIVFIVIY